MSSSKSGWAQVDITPPLGLPMGGRGPRFSPGASVLDPLFAQALVLENGAGDRTLWISLDLIGLSFATTTQFRHELAAITAIPPGAIILNFSHTHNGPMTGFDGYATLIPWPEALKEYEQGLLPRIGRAAIDAVDSLRPATVRVHRGRSEVGINRRNRGESGEMGLRPNLDGVYNPDLWVLDIASESGRAIVFSYGCHPVTVYGYDWDGISADYPGVCRNRLAETYGDGLHAQFIQGLAGNVRPRRLADFETNSFRKSTPDVTTGAGADLADDIVKALDTDGELLDLDLAFAEGTALAPKDPKAVLPREHWQSLSQSDEELDRNLGAYWADRLESGLPPSRVLPWAVGLIRLAKGHTIAWLAGEVFAEWLGMLRTWLKEPGLTAWGYCQDGRCYMPPDSVIPEGGYEIVAANAYTTTGPGPFCLGMDEAARREFEALAAAIG